MATAAGARDGELRRSVAASLAAFGDALLRGPAPRALLYALIVFLELALVASLKSRILASPRCMVRPETTTLGALPDFVPPDVARALAEVRAPAARSIADPGLDEDLRAAFEAHPWVRRVAHVGRSYPSRVAVDVELRRPFALVDVEAWRLTVDREGVVLDDRSSRAPAGLPVVRSDKKATPGVPRVGRPFRSPAVLRGLSVLRELGARADHPFLRDFRVAAIDVTAAGGKSGGDLRLELSAGAAVVWGSAPDDETAALEPDPTRKLDLLYEAAAAYPGLRGVASVNVVASSPFVSLVE